MAVVSVRTLHERTGALVDQAAHGQIVVVTRRGRPVAELVPLAARGGAPTMPDLSEFLAQFPEVPGDSGRFLEEDRS